MTGGLSVRREALVGLGVDTRGWIFIQRSLALSILPRLQIGDYLSGVEINAWAIREGVTPVEIPVLYTASGRSTVSPVRDSINMAMGLIALRHRLAADGQPSRVSGGVPA